MTDTRRQIAERHQEEWWTIAPKYRTGERLEQLIQSALSEYAAAVLEEMANKVTDSVEWQTETDWVRCSNIRQIKKWLEARAKQERER